MVIDVVGVAVGCQVDLPEQALVSLAEGQGEMTLLRATQLG